MPLTRKWLKIVGVYDGDQRNSKKQTDYHWPIVFLPGADDPAKLLSELAKKAGAAEFLAAALTKPSGMIAIALDTASGLDFHDWVPAVGNSLKVDPTILVRILVQLWLSDTNNNAAAQSLIAEIHKALDKAG